MPIQDLTDDPRADMALAQQIGSGFAGFMQHRRQKQQLDEQKEKRMLQHAFTTKLLSSDLEGQDLLNAFNNMPGAVDNALLQKLNQKTLESRALGLPDQNTQTLGKLIGDYRKLFQWDGMQQQFIPVPGSEALRQGYEKGIKNTMERINEATSIQEKPAPAVQPALPEATPTETLKEKMKNVPVEVPEAPEAPEAPTGTLKERIDAIKAGPGTPKEKRTLMAEAVKQFKGEAAPTATDEPAKPTTQAEYDAIPKGALFIDTDGTLKRKQ